MSVYGEERYAEHHDVAHLERRIDELRQNLATLAEDQDLAELIRQIRKPGYTTPAEFTLVLGLSKACTYKRGRWRNSSELFLSEARRSN